MIEIIPAIDLIEGRAVRLRQGDFARKTVYSEKPFELAQQFEDVGLQRLHIVDLDGARTGKISNLAVLELIAANTNLTIDFGGGVKTRDDAVSVFNAGAKILTIGSVAVKEPELFESWLAEFGDDRILLGADVKNGKIFINGWQTTTDVELVLFLRGWLEKGVRQVFCTDISRDGLLEGAASALYQEIHTELPEIYLIASGGIASIDDLDELEKSGCRAAIIGKAIYENKISLSEIETYLKNAG
ncbi:MAG: 1-(5-phosphoribosyl)-5-[(5-phosphoribosylamino)methylideneamino]imidazole-4-carboxamide isomerase [Pyrinomonadaceae bacterium]